MKTTSFLIMSLLFTSSVSVAQNSPNKASPFDAIRWADQLPQVKIEEEWYTPISIDDVSVDKIIKKCLQRWPGKLQKRFSEDLMEAMALLGHSPGATVAHCDVPKAPTRALRFCSSSWVQKKGLPFPSNC